MSATGSYWSIDACGWVASPRRADALATPWSGYEVPVPQRRTAVRDGWDVLGWFPPLPGMPQQRPTGHDVERIEQPT